MPRTYVLILRSAPKGRVSKDANCRRRDRLWLLATLLADRAAVFVAAPLFPAAARRRRGDQPDAGGGYHPALHTAVDLRAKRLRKPGEPRQLPADRRGRSARLRPF